MKAGIDDRRIESDQARVPQDAPMAMDGATDRACNASTYRHRLERDCGSAAQAPK